MVLGYLISPVVQIVDNNGKPIVGAKIYVYKAGTTNTVNTYRDFSNHYNTTPVLTDTLGNCTIIASDDMIYDIVVKDNRNNLLMSKDNLTVSSGINPDINLRFNEGYGIIIRKNGNTVTIAVDTDLVATKDDLAAKQDKLTPGDNIDITDNNIINVVNRKTLYTQWPLKVDRGSSMVKVYLDQDFVDKADSNTEILPGADLISYIDASGKQVIGVDTTSSATGNYNFYAGYNNEINGNYNAVFGDENSATCNDSLLYGYHNNIGGNSTNDLVGGYNNTISNAANTCVIGMDNNVGGDFQYIFGQGNNAGGEYNTCFGRFGEVGGSYNICFGLQNRSYGERNLVFGKTNNTVSYSYSNLVGGVDNVVGGACNIVAGAGNNAALANTFVIGNANSGNADNSIIAGTNNNSFSGNKDDLVIGYENFIQDIDSSVIAGYNNKVYGIQEFGLVVTANDVIGSNNTISGYSNNIIGDSNTISGHSIYAFGQGITASNTSIEGDIYAIGKNLNNPTPGWLTMGMGGPAKIEIAYGGTYLNGSVAVNDTISQMRSYSQNYWSNLSFGLNNSKLVAQRHDYQDQSDILSELVINEQHTQDVDLTLYNKTDGKTYSLLKLCRALDAAGYDIVV